MAQCGFLGIIINNKCLSLNSHILLGFAHSVRKVKKSITQLYFLAKRKFSFSSIAIYTAKFIVEPRY